MQPFTDSDEDGELFAGRDADIEMVVANLRAARLTILYGPSGAGKSSLLQAGAARRISVQARAERAGEHAPTVIFHGEWAGDPGVALARRIAPPGAPDADPPPLDEAIEHWCRNHKGTLLLILDQFEEYLRLHPEAGEDSLDELLPEIIDRLDLRVRILISLRDDALSELDRFEGRVTGLFDNYLRLPPLTRAAAREAIVKPIGKVNEWRESAGKPKVDIEDGLVDDVLAQLADPRTASPPAADVIEPAFLQLAMQRLWDADAGADPPVLRRATLKDVGGAAAIVRRHVDRAMQALTKSQQEVCAAIFDYLVTPSGAKIRWTPDDLAGKRYADQPAGEVADVLVALSKPDLRIVRRVPAPNGDPDSQGFEIFHDVLGDAVRDWARRRHEERLERRNSRLAAAVAALLAITIGLLAYTAHPGLVQDLELAAVDERFVLRGGHKPDPKIVLVGLDDRSVSAFKRRPAGTDTRRDYAEVLAKVHSGRPKAIAVAFEYRNPPSDGNGGEEGTRLLKRAFRDAKPVIATLRIDNAGDTTMFGDETRRSKSFHGASAGYAAFPADHDNVARRVYAEGRQIDADGSKVDKGLASLAALVARRAGARVDTSDPPAMIDFAGAPGAYRHVSVIDVLDGVVRPAAFADKIVVIGDMAPKVPTAAGRMSEAELHANAIATMRDGVPLRKAPGWLTIVLVIGLSLLASVLALRCRPAVAVALSAGAGVLLLVAAQLSFNAGVVIAIVPPLAALVVAIVGGQVARRASRIGDRAPGASIEPAPPASTARNA